MDSKELAESILKDLSNNNTSDLEAAIDEILKDYYTDYTTV